MALFSTIRLPIMSYSDGLVTVVGAGLIAHLIFKRTETHEPLAILLLLVGIPATLALVYASYYTSTLYALSTIFGVYWTSLLTSILVYRVSPWHPLAKYPGPFMCRLSKFYFAFLSLKGKQHMYYTELHKRYGDIVRVGPNELSIRDVNAVLPLMGPAGLPKGTFWEGRVPEHEAVKPLIALRDKQEHARRRRPWTRAFNTSALKGYEAMVTNRSVQLVETLAAQKGPVNLTQWISFFSFDIMNDLAFGGGTEMMRDGDVDGLWHLLEAGQKNAIFMSHVPWLGALFLRLPNLAKDLKAFRAYAKNRAMARKKQGSPHKDLFYYLMDEDGKSKQPPSVAEAVNDGGLAIIAGSDTTSSALTNLFYFLMQNPTAFKRLQTEIDQLGDDIMDCAKQAHLPYLNGAINESLRLFPPVLCGSQRAPEKGSGGVFVGAHYIPEGANVFIPTYCIQRDPRYFSPQPDLFLPERWLTREQRCVLEPSLFSRNEDFVLNTTAFAPFSLGPANCAGKNLAWMEMRMLVCLMMQKFELKFAASYNPEQWYTDMMDYFVTLKGDLPVILSSKR